MMIPIPFKKYSKFEIELTLDDVNYLLKFIWNSRGEYWTVSFYNPVDNAPYVTGIKIVLNYDILAPFVGKGLPPGTLFALDVGEDTSRIQKLDFYNGSRTLYYLDSTEFVRN